MSTKNLGQVPDFKSTQGHTMRYIYVCLLIFLASACTGSPDPETVGPTTIQPIFFQSPTNNKLIDSNKPIEVTLRLSEVTEFTSFTLFANNRQVGLFEKNKNIWVSDPADDALLTFTPGQHTLTAYAESTEGETYSRSITIYAKVDDTVPPVLNNDIRITDVTILNSATGIPYTNINEGTPEIPIEDLQGGGITVQASYEGDVYAVSFYGSALEEESVVYSPDDFEVRINEEDAGYRHGEYSLWITPLGSIQGELTSGASALVTFRVLDAQLRASTRTLDILQSLNLEVPYLSEILIENIGNRTGAYQLINIPEWLEVDLPEGSVEPKAIGSIIATTAPCNAISSTEATIKLVANGRESEIVARRECVDGPIFDLSLDRFYFNQAIPANDSDTHSEGANIELVARRQGLARAFVTRRGNSDSRLPLVQLHYRKASGLEGYYDLSGPSSVIPETIYEGALEQTFNATLPASFFEPGTEFYVSLDPGNEISERIETNNRYPSEGYLPLKIREVPPLKITLVPMVRNGSDAPPELFEALVPELIERTMVLMPLENYEIKVREQPFVYTRTSWPGAVSELDSLRQSENGEGIYLGLVQESVDEDSRYGGYAELNGFAAVSLPRPDIIAHEIGHNFGLRHANCGSPIGIDPRYPHEDAQTNLWGYNIFSGFLKPPASHDFMSYCNPDWISAYHYGKILEARGGNIFPSAISAEKAIGQEKITDQEWLTISGIINGSKAEIHHIYRRIGQAEPTSSHRKLSFRLFNNSDTEIYRGVLGISELDHSSHNLFKIQIPSSEIHDDISRVIIENNNIIYLNKSWRTKTAASSDKLFDTIKTSRIDQDKILIEWPVEDGGSLWITDRKTNNLLAIDTTGKVVVYSKSNQLQLKLTRQGREQTRVVAVE